MLFCGKPKCGENGRLHHRYLSAMQQLRGRVYLCDGAIRPYEIELDGRFKIDGDEDAWRLLLVDDADEIIGCTRYMVYLGEGPAMGFETETGGRGGSSTCPERNFLYVDIGRLGGSSFQSTGETLPVYFDAQYGCNMELLRFQNRCPVSRFEPLIKQLTSKPEAVHVITAARYSSAASDPFHACAIDPLAEAFICHCVSRAISDDSALQGHSLEQLIDAATPQAQRSAGMWTEP